MTLTKPWGIIRHQKAEMENYNPEVIAEFDTEEEALRGMASYEDAGNMSEGYGLVYRDDAGVICDYGGEPVEMPTY